MIWSRFNLLAFGEFLQAPRQKVQAKDEILPIQPLSLQIYSLLIGDFVLEKAEMLLIVN